LAHKAKLLVDSRTYGGRGRQAILADPEARYSPSLLPAAAIRPTIGRSRRLILEFLARQGCRYGSRLLPGLFGYDVYDVASDDGLEHVILSTDDVARASANEHPTRA